MKKKLYSALVLGMLVFSGCNMSWLFPPRDEEGAVPPVDESTTEGMMIDDDDPTNDDDDMIDDVPADSTDGEESTENTAGVYTDYDPALLSRYSGRNIVLFFKADWCPSCRAIDQDIRANLSDIPADTVILKVDYDNSADLKSKYGVTHQHTFVEVDGNGNKINLWNGGATLEDILEHVES